MPNGNVSQTRTQPEKPKEILLIYLYLHFFSLLFPTNRKYKCPSFSTPKRWSLQLDALLVFRRWRLRGSMFRFAVWMLRASMLWKLRAALMWRRRAEVIKTVLCELETVELSTWSTCEPLAVIVQLNVSKSITWQIGKRLFVRCIVDFPSPAVLAKTIRRKFASRCSDVGQKASCSYLQQQNALEDN